MPDPRRRWLRIFTVHGNRRSCNPTGPGPMDESVKPVSHARSRVPGDAGASRFDPRTNSSGAILNRFSGAYLSGEHTDTIDTIAMTDDGCVGTATVTVHVVRALEVEPVSVVIPPANRFTYRVSY